MQEETLHEHRRDDDEVYIGGSSAGDVQYSTSSVEHTGGSVDQVSTTTADDPNAHKRFKTISLSSVVVAGFLSLMLILLLIVLLPLASSAEKSFGIAINLLAKQTMLQASEQMHYRFRSFNDSVSAVHNFTLRHGSPFKSPAGTTRREIEFSLWDSFLLQQAMFLTLDTAVLARFASDNAVFVALNFQRGVGQSPLIKTQVCQSSYSSALEVPSTTVWDHYVNCTLQPFVLREDSHQFMIPGPTTPEATVSIPTQAQFGYLGARWNITMNTLLNFNNNKKKEDKAYMFWQETPRMIGFGGGFLGMTGTNNYLAYQLSSGVFDPSAPDDVSKVIAHAHATCVGSSFGPVLRDVLPTVNGNSDVIGARAYLVDRFDNVIGASNLKETFTIIPGATGPRKGCFGLPGGALGCFYNYTDYAPLDLLRVVKVLYKGSWEVITTSFRSTPLYRAAMTRSGDSASIDSTETDNLIVFREKMGHTIPQSYQFEMFVVIPNSYFVAGIVQARTTTIAVVIVVTLIGAVLSYFMIFLATRSIAGLLEKMKDPFSAKLKKREKLSTSTTSSESASVSSQNKPDTDTSTPGEKGGSSGVVVDNNNNKKESSSNKSSESNESDKKERSGTTTTATIIESSSSSWWQSILDWQPEELELLENEFADFRAVILQLSGFLNFKFKSRRRDSMMKNKKLSKFEEAIVEEDVTAEKKTTSASSSTLQKAAAAAASPSPATKKRKGVHFAVAQKDDDNNNNINNKSDTKNQQQQQNKKVAKSSAAAAATTDVPGSPPPRSPSNNNDNKNKSEEDVDFLPSPTMEPLPGHPHFRTIVKRKHSKRKAFVACVHSLPFSSPDLFFLLNNSGGFPGGSPSGGSSSGGSSSGSIYQREEDDDSSVSSIRKNAFLKFSQKLVLACVQIATGCGATLLDMHGDQILFCIQVVPNLNRTRAPTRFVRQLMKVTNLMHVSLRDFAQKLLTNSSSASSPSNTITTTATNNNSGSPTLFKQQQQQENASSDSSSNLTPEQHHVFSRLNREKFAILSAGVTLGDANLVKMSDASFAPSRPISFVGPCFSAAVAIERRMRYEAHTGNARDDLSATTANADLLPSMSLCHSIGFPENENQMFSSVDCCELVAGSSRPRYLQSKMMKHSKLQATTPILRILDFENP